MNLYIVRHGQTDYNLNHIIQGISNIPLNSNGMRQIQKLKGELDKLKIDLAITSPLLRTRQTTKILLDTRNVPIIIDDRITERKMGILEGKSTKMYDAKSYWNYQLNYDNNEQVEKIKDLFHRTRIFLIDIIKTYPNKNILIVSHGATIRALHYNIVGFNASDYLLKLKVPNGCLFKYHM